MNTKITIILLFAAFSMTSCSNSGDDLQKQVFAIHDEVMPKMDDIYSLRKDLLEVKANGTATQKTLSDSEKEEISHVCDSLTAAQIAMEDWMHAYKPDIEAASNSEKAAYFTAELPKINKVRSIMLKMIQLGKETCAKYPKIQTEKAAEKPAEKTETKTAATQSTATATKTETKTSDEKTVKTEKTPAAKTEVKASAEAPKTPEKTAETTEKAEKVPSQPAPPPPPASNIKTVQPRVSAGATKVPR